METILAKQMQASGLDNQCEISKVVNAEGIHIGIRFGKEVALGQSNHVDNRFNIQPTINDMLYNLLREFPNLESRTRQEQLQVEFIGKWIVITEY